MLIIPSQSSLVLITWHELEGILRRLSKKDIVSIYTHGFEGDILGINTKLEIIDMIYKENEGEIT